MDKIWMFVAFKLPRRLVYMCGIRLWAYSTQGKWSHCDAVGVKMEEALSRWEAQG